MVGVSLNGRRINVSKAFRGMNAAFRPSAVDGVLDVFFMRVRIAEIDPRDPDAQGDTVRKVSEHLSAVSAV